MAEIPAEAVQAAARALWEIEFTTDDELIIRWEKARD